MASSCTKGENFIERLRGVQKMAGLVQKMTFLEPWPERVAAMPSCQAKRVFLAPTTSLVLEFPFWVTIQSKLAMTQVIRGLQVMVDDVYPSITLYESS
jgi:hypothetical protein